MTVLVRRPVPVVAVVALLLSAGAAFVLMNVSGGVKPRGPSLDAMGDAVGASLMRRVVRGHVPGRSGEITIVPRPNAYMAPPWDLRTWGSERPFTFTSHATGWRYLDHVPLIVYGGKDAVREVARQQRVGAASLAATYARFVGLDGFDSDAAPLPGLRASDPPRAIVTVIIDGGGWNVLRAFPEAWPDLRALARDGTSFVNASVGSMPSVTAPVHTTFGTGRYPSNHGVPANPWLSIDDPTTIRVETVSEAWDAATRNRATVAGVMYEGTHLGMLGVGTARDGGDADIAVLWSGLREKWTTNRRLYELPPYVTRSTEQQVRRLIPRMDGRDATRDGTWFGHPLTDLDRESLPGTPAFVQMTGAAAIKVLRRERVGYDGITDFVWIEFKSPDFAGHAYGMSAPEVGDVLGAVDEELGTLRDELDALVPDGDYLLTVSADHGQQPLADDVLGWPINKLELEHDLAARFDGAVERITPIDLQIDVDRVRDDPDIGLSDIARFLGTYRVSDNIPVGLEGADRLPPSLLDNRIFAGAFPGDYLRTLSQEKIASFGPSAYRGPDSTAP